MEVEVFLKPSSYIINVYLIVYKLHIPIIFPHIPIIFWEKKKISCLPFL